MEGRDRRLADAGFGQFNRHAQVDFAQNRVQPGIAGLLAKPFGRDLEARQRPAIHAAIEQSQSLSVSSTSSALRPLATARFLRSAGFSTPCKAISASTVETARSEPAAAELRGASCSLTVKAPPALRRAVAGADASAVPFDP